MGFMSLDVLGLTTLLQPAAVGSLPRLRGRGGEGGHSHEF